MFCCSKCFDDISLVGTHFTEYHVDAGQCSYCNSTDGLLLPPDHLRDHFERVVGAYRESRDGITLLELLRMDWGVFSATISNTDAGRLLQDILGDASVTDLSFVPVNDGAAAVSAEWLAFKRELMLSNRYHPKSKLNIEKLGYLFQYLIAPSGEFESTWYRARIQGAQGPFVADQMGAPPPGLASSGRANPAGISYLYLASDTQTAVAEIRPHMGEKVSVAQFKIPSGLKFVDLRDPRRRVSPFELEDETEVAQFLVELEFLDQLGDELTRPVVPSSAATEYVPSQYLCEFVKHENYDGVVYRSSVGEGVNLALFDATSYSAMLVESVDITRVDLDYVPVDA